MALFTTAELESWLHLSSGTIDRALGYLLHREAVSYLESETGVRLSQDTATITYTPRWDDCWISLPVPTTAVSAVSVDGTALTSDDYTLVENRLYRSVGWGGSRWSDDRFAYRSSSDDYASVDVTLTYGFTEDTAPSEFRTWGLVLASQAYQLSPSLNRQSVRLDDYAETFATGGDLVAVGMGLPPRVLGKLKARYGRGAAAVDAR